MTTTETKPFVPDFGDDEEDRTIAFVCSKGSLDMAYPGLIMANGAIESGMEAHLFFTFWGMDMITKKRQDHLHFSPVGNLAAHMPAALAPLPGMQTMATSMMKKQIADLGIPSVPEFIAHLSEMGAHFWACRLSVDMFGLEREDMIDELEGILNVSDFIEITKDAEIMFI
jgi:peroxiredoxin family protein